MAQRTRTTFADDGQPDGLLELVLRAREGDEKAFEILYMRFIGPISRYACYLVGDDGVGCELAQEASLKAWKAIKRIRQPEGFTGWLYRITANCVYDYQRRNRHLQTVSLETFSGTEQFFSVAGPEGHIENNEFWRTALAQLRPIYRECLILYEIEELSQRQIAEIVDINGASVSAYISRGKKQLLKIYLQLNKDPHDNSRGGQTRIW